MYTSLSIKEEGLKKKDTNKELVARLKKKQQKQLDQQVHGFHNEAFEKIDCLECANCCKTTSPIFKEGDIARLSKALKLKVPEFINQYLYMDSDGDYVLHIAPCPFLAADHKCIVYDQRPTACKEYPHTNRKRFYQILKLSLKNTEICPAVQHVFDRLREQYK